MRETVIRCLVCLAAVLPLAACERGAQGPDNEGLETTAPAAGAPAGDANADPEATAPAVPPAGAAPEASPPAPGEIGAPTAAPEISTPLASTTDEVPRMPVTEASALVQDGGAVLVDVRDAESFREDRIAGAVGIPLGEIAARANELPRDKVIVTYCA